MVFYIGNSESEISTLFTQNGAHDPQNAIPGIPPCKACFHNRCICEKSDADADTTAEDGNNSEIWKETDRVDFNRESQSLRSLILGLLSKNKIEDAIDLLDEAFETAGEYNISMLLDIAYEAYEYLMNNENFDAAADLGNYMKGWGQDFVSKWNNDLQITPPSPQNHPTAAPSPF